MYVLIAIAAILAVAGLVKLAQVIAAAVAAAASAAASTAVDALAIIGKGLLIVCAVALLSYVTGAIIAGRRSRGEVSHNDKFAEPLATMRESPTPVAHPVAIDQQEASHDKIDDSQPAAEPAATSESWQDPATCICGPGGNQRDGDDSNESDAYFAADPDDIRLPRAAADSPPYPDAMLFIDGLGVPGYLNGSKIRQSNLPTSGPSDPKHPFSPVNDLIQVTIVLELTDRLPDGFNSDDVLGSLDINEVDVLLIGRGNKVVYQSRCRVKRIEIDASQLWECLSSDALKALDALILNPDNAQANQKFRNALPDWRQPTVNGSSIDVRSGGQVNVGKCNVYIETHNCRIPVDSRTVIRAGHVPIHCILKNNEDLVSQFARALSPDGSKTDRSEFSRKICKALTRLDPVKVIRSPDFSCDKIRRSIPSLDGQALNIYRAPMVAYPSAKIFTKPQRADIGKVETDLEDDLTDILSKLPDSPRSAKSKDGLLHGPRAQSRDSPESFPQRGRDKPFNGPSVR